MTISEMELKIGQLALARGLIELSSLLESVTKATAENSTLTLRLIEDQLLDGDTIDELREELRGMNNEQWNELVDQGETIIMQTLLDREIENNQPLLDALLDFETTATIDMAPREKLSSQAAQTEAATGTEHGEDAQGHSPSPGSAESKYEFLEELGRGGMGQILRAHDLVLDREIALKTLLPESSVTEPQRRLIAEARLTGRLEHPSIVPVYELGYLSNGEPFYTMRVVTERSLETILQELRDDHPDAPSLLQLIQILRQVCLAIEYAHDHGVIHRDLKPENILIGNYGEVFVIDWGIAKILTQSWNIPDPTSVSALREGALVGTPRYMSPEQAYGNNDEVDERTDVYALGALLYELLTLGPIFSNPTVLGLLMTIIQEEPEPPSKRAPDRSIPSALEEIAMRAISKDPDDRYPSAQAFADELDLFLEGVKEKERKIGNARELIQKASQVRDQYHQARKNLTQAMEKRGALRSETSAWAQSSERARLWESEDFVEDLQVTVERHFGETIRLLSQSIGYISLPEAHDALAGLYWERFIKAENRGERVMATYFENLVRQHDTGMFADRLRGLANLEVTTSVASEITLARVNERQRRLVADEVIASSTDQLQLERLPHGLYQLNIAAKEYASIQLPLLLDRQASLKVNLQLWLNKVIPDDFIIIPEGPFITGTPQEFEFSQNRTYLPTYAIKKTPVTCAEYLTFLNDLAARDLQLAKKHAPRSKQENSPSYFPLVDGRFTIPEEDAEGDSWDPNWPICIINYYDACAYADWRSKRDDLCFHLPTSLEWEKAARGIDGRLYPWGNHFDSSFCKMRDSTPGKPMPAPVGSFAGDRSPYGVADMAGTIIEWTSTPRDSTEDAFVLRGGSYHSIAMMCRLDWHMHSPASFRNPHYGFRLILELEKGKPRSLKD